MQNQHYFYSSKLKSILSSSFTIFFIFLIWLPTFWKWEFPYFLKTLIPMPHILNFCFTSLVSPSPNDKMTYGTWLSKFSELQNQL